MGDMADRQFDLDMEKAERCRNLEEQEVWVTREGDEIPVKEMRTGHIRNALAMLKRAGVIGPSTLSFYLNTPGPQGDMACDAFDAELREVFDSPVNPFVDIFENELKLREGRE